ncbi:MAG TPA: CvpA family protein [Candidatus Cloacimonetes bacterium]|nr:CvpA family protein [Candidatus Cloacimonadota bacterium]
MDIINIIALGIILVFGGFGFISGFIKGSARLIGWIVALILAIKLGPASSVFFQNTFHFSVKTSNILGGVLVFIIVMIIIAIIVKLLKKMVKALHLSFLDKLLGFILGCFQAMIVVFLLSLFVQILPITEQTKTTITNAAFVEWNNEKIARILEATKLDSQIRNNSYYKELLKLQYKIKKDVTAAVSPLS